MGGLGSIDEIFQNVCKKLDLEFLFSECLMKVAEQIISTLMLGQEWIGSMEARLDFRGFKNLLKEQKD